MPFVAINPANEEEIARFDAHTTKEIEREA